METIGDCLLVVSGLPVRNGNRHAAEIADMAFDILSLMTHFKIRHRPRMKLQLRVGLHSGKQIHCHALFYVSKAPIYRFPSTLAAVRMQGAKKG